MANKMLTTDEFADLMYRSQCRPAIWYCDQSGLWWMETAKPLKNLEWLRAHVDAIRVTNAYESLNPEFIDHLVQHGSYHERKRA